MPPLQSMTSKNICPRTLLESKILRHSNRDPHHESTHLSNPIIQTQVHQSSPYILPATTTITNTIPPHPENAYVNNLPQVHGAYYPKSLSLQPVPATAKPVSTSKSSAYLVQFKDIQAVRMTKKLAHHCPRASPIPWHHPHLLRSRIRPPLLANSKPMSNLTKFNLSRDPHPNV